MAGTVQIDQADEAFAAVDRSLPTTWYDCF